MRARGDKTASTISILLDRLNACLVSVGMPLSYVVVILCMKGNPLLGFGGTAAIASIDLVIVARGEQRGLVLLQ